MEQLVLNMMATTMNAHLLLLTLGLWTVKKADSNPFANSLSQNHEVSSELEIWANRQRRKAHEKCKEYIQYACQNQIFKEKSSDKDRVLNGEYVPEGMLPHMAYIIIIARNVRGKKTSFDCGGTLISEKFVMTAAHCTCDYIRIKVKLGSLYNTNDGTGQWFSVRDIYIHPRYSCELDFNDIALLKLSKKVEFSTHIRPICLNINYEDEYSRIIVSGWGHTEDQEISERLKMAEVKINGQSLQLACRQFLEKEGSYDVYKNQTICAGDLRGKKDTCEGDSGGPLQVPLSYGCPNTYEQLGITSFGEGDCLPGSDVPKIGIYTKVAYHVPWIANIVWPDRRSKYRN